MAQGGGGVPTDSRSGDELGGRPNAHGIGRVGSGGIVPVGRGDDAGIGRGGGDP